MLKFSRYMNVPVTDLFVDIHIGELCLIPDILVLEGQHAPVCIGDDEICEDEGKHSKDDRGNKIGKQHPAEADPAGQDRNDLAPGGHSRSKEDDRDEDQQVAEKVDEIGDEVEVVIE